MVIELDFPPMDLFPNRAKGRHWAALHATKKAYRENSGWLAKHQIRNWTPTADNIALTLTFEMPDRRMRDADNCLAAAKAGLDGLADALQVNDHQFQPIIIHRKLGSKPGRLVVQIGQVD